MAKKTSTTFSVHYVCTNCGNEFDNKLTKGTSAPAFITCPNCECRTGRPAHRLAEMNKQKRGGSVSDVQAPDQNDEAEEEAVEEDDDDNEVQNADDGLTPEERAARVRDSLTDVHTNTHPENGDPTKRFILVGSNILNKRGEILGYVPASEESFEQLKAQFGGKKELQEFLQRIKVMPQTLVELYGVNPDECYFLEMLDRKWEHKRRNLPELPVLPALTDGDYDGYKKSLGIID